MSTTLNGTLRLKKAIHSMLTTRVSIVLSSLALVAVAMSSIAVAQADPRIWSVSSASKHQGYEILLDSHDKSDPAILEYIPEFGIERFSLTSGEHTLLDGSEAVGDPKFKSWGVLPDGRIILISDRGLHIFAGKKLRDVGCLLPGSSTNTDTSAHSEDSSSEEPTALNGSFEFLRNNCASSEPSPDSDGETFTSLSVSPSGNVFILSHVRSNKGAVKHRRVYEAIEPEVGNGDWALSLIAGGGASPITEIARDALSIGLGRVETPSHSLKRSVSHMDLPAPHPIAATNSGGFLLVGSNGLLRAEKDGDGFTIRELSSLSIESEGGTDTFAPNSVYKGFNGEILVDAFWNADGPGAVFDVPPDGNFEGKPLRVVLRVSADGDDVSIVLGGGSKPLGSLQHGKRARSAKLDGDALSWLVPTPCGGFFFRSHKRDLDFVGPDKSDEKLKALMTSAVTGFHNHSAGSTNAVITSLQRTRMLALKTSTRPPLTSNAEQTKRQKKRAEKMRAINLRPGLRGIQDDFNFDLAVLEAKVAKKRQAAAAAEQEFQNAAHGITSAERLGNKDVAARLREEARLIKLRLMVASAKVALVEARLEEFKASGLPTSFRAIPNDVIRRIEGYSTAELKASQREVDRGLNPSVTPSDDLEFENIAQPVLEWWWAFRATLAQKLIIKEVVQTTEIATKVLASSNEL